MPRRLRLERPWQEHADLYQELFADSVVAATLWPGALGGARTPRQASEILTADIGHWQRDSFGPWMFFEEATGAFVGRGGLRRCTIAGSECVELLYAVRPEAWGQGHATEIAFASQACARDLGLSEIVGMTLLTNVASRRVLEKAGLRFDRVQAHAGLPHWLGRLVLADGR
jgi:ribosomal-protein-alanine N-acetyltransferase